MKRSGINARIEAFIRHLHRLVKLTSIFGHPCDNGYGRFVQNYYRECFLLFDAYLLLGSHDLPFRYRAGNNVKQGVWIEARRGFKSGEPRRTPDPQFYFEVFPLVKELSSSDRNGLDAANRCYFRSVEAVTTPGGFGMNGL